MKKKLLSLIALAIGFVGCNNDLTEEAALSLNNKDIVTVNMEQSGSRTAMDGRSVVWSVNDAIGIFIGTANKQYELKSGAGTTSGTFEPKELQVVTNNVKEYAYFPYVETATVSSGVISTVLPETYTYSEGANNNAVMAAKMGAGNQSTISFKNAGALYAITVENIPAGYNKAVMTYLNANDEVGIAGNATISFNQNGDPILAVPDVTSAKKKITVTFTSSNAPTTKTFYFPMPIKDAAGYANNLQFSLESDANLEAKKAPVFTVEPQRNNLYKVTLELDMVSGNVVAEAADVTAANNALANDKTSSVSVQTVNAGDQLTIPAKTTSDADVPHTINLSNAQLPANGTLSIKVVEATPSETDKGTVDELTIIVPNGTTSTGSLSIDAPSTTVTIQCEDGTIIETLTATTAQNTLVIGSGVTVKNLTVMAGNVRVEGGTIESIINSTSATLYLINEGGTIPNNLSNDIVVLNVTDGVYSVSTSEQLAYVISQGVTNIMLADGTYQMPAAAKGKTLTISGTTKAVIKVVPGGQNEANGQLDYSLDGSTVTFNGVTIETNSQLYAGYARLSAVYNNCVIQNTYNLGTGTSVFNGCTFNITNEYLRVGGANSATFDNCTFNTDGRAILVFQDGTSVAQSVTVKDCTFNATAAAYTWDKKHVAAVSIDGTNGTYTVNLEGTNTVDSDFNGLWQIKAGNDNVTVNESVDE